MTKRKDTAKYANLGFRSQIVAKFAHRCQVDKSGVDYWRHLQAVADACETEVERAVAWLHDTPEDTPLSVDDLRELNFPEVVVDAVGLLTDAPHLMSHDDYLRRLRDATSIGAPLARRVKPKDVAHNADPERGGYLTPEKRARRAAHAMDILEGRIP